MARTVYLAAVLLFCAPTLHTVIFAAEPAKHAVPDEAAQAEASRLVADLYKTEYQNAKTPEQKRVLSQAMIKVGGETTGDPAGQYVLFRIARDIGIGIGDAETTLIAISNIATRFTVDETAMQADALGQLVTNATKLADKKALINPIQATARDCILIDDFDVARKLLTHGIAVAKDTREAISLKEMQSLLEEVDVMAAEYIAVKPSLDALLRSPSDKDANLAVGRYRCFIKNEWDSGLLMLAIGSDETLSELAKAELADMPSAMIIADGWWQLAEKTPGSAGTNIKVHAASWYKRDLPSLSGLAKVKVERRIAEIPAHQSVASPSVRATAAQKPQRVVFLNSSYDVKSSTDQGDWAFKDGKLFGVADPKPAKIKIGTIDFKQYDLEVDFVIAKRSDVGSGDVIFELPAVKSGLCIRTTRDNKTIGGFWVAGSLGDPKVSSAFAGRLAVGQPHKLRVRVLGDGGDVRIALDGKAIAVARGLPGVNRRNDDPPLYITLSPGLHVVFSAITVTEIPPADDKTSNKKSLPVKVKFANKKALSGTAALSQGARIAGNRTYTFGAIPEQIAGYQFVRPIFDEVSDVELQVPGGATVVLLGVDTPSLHTAYETLEKDGWLTAGALSARLPRDQPQRMLIFKRSFLQDSVITLDAKLVQNHLVIAANVLEAE